MVKLPDPLTPSDCDLRGLVFMPLDVLRLRDSDLALMADGDEFKAAVLLWCASWHQTPAASLPTEDRVLCRLSGLDAKVWRRAKAGALRGWVACADGRLYHPVVAEKALEAWRERQAYRRKRDMDRERLKDWRDRKQARGGGEAAGETGCETQTETRFETPKTGEGQGSGGTEDVSVPNGTVSAAQPSDDQRFVEIGLQPDAGKRGWDGLAFVLTVRGALTESKAKNLIGKWKRDHALTGDEMWAMAEGAWKAETHDPSPYLARAAAQIADRRAKAQAQPDLSGDVPDHVQRRWMQDFREAPHQWKRQERGPKPGEAGCRVRPEIQREFGAQGEGAQTGRFI